MFTNGQQAFKMQTFPKMFTSLISNNYHLKLKIKHQKIQVGFTSCKGKPLLKISCYHFLIQEYLFTYASTGILG